MEELKKLEKDCIEENFFTYLEVGKDASIGDIFIMQPL
jgi:hypothetical protein